MRFVFLIFCLISFAPITAQKLVRNELISDERIKSVLLQRQGWELSYPVIRLNSDEKLILRFDLIGDDPDSYYYRFVHCDKDWNESGIFVNDYLDGFPENPVEDYKASFNTTVHYFHYNLLFPNDRVKFNISGNYIIIIYKPEEPDKTVLTRRFVIAEDAASVKVNVHRPQMTNNSDTHQQIDFTVNHGRVNITDPYRNVYAAILQNGVWSTAKTNLKPEFYGNNELKYSSLSESNIFAGGNEFRYFDIKSIRYNSENVRSIEFIYPYYNVFLYPSDNREFKPYFYRKDLNGKYYVAFQEGRNADTDADYVYVYFTLPAYQPAEGGSMYVFGALSDWKTGKGNRMHFNSEKRQYECSMLLKQGWYDYQYVFVKDGEDTPVTGPFEGNHYETENDYSILVYYRNPRERYDRVIGSATANTLNRISD
ncbi:MAG TPA: DUF5103 domain-containing protein [Bacteroidales bacterium]|jgi:hypothetical protein|nr:DUF5103 domain-containing protein [Bacteroidales bacterium]